MTTLGITSSTQENDVNISKIFLLMFIIFIIFKTINYVISWKK